MRIRDTLRKLINPGAVSQPPLSKTPEVAVPSPNPGAQEGVGVATEPQENTPIAETVAPPTPEQSVTPAPPEQVKQSVTAEKSKVGLGAIAETEPGGTVHPNVEGKSAQSEGVAPTPQAPGTGETLP